MKKQKIIKINAVTITAIFLLANLASVFGNNIVPSIAYFNADKTIADVNEPITFSLSPSNVEFTSIANFYVDFHDGTLPIKLTADELSVTHKFAYEGKYLVTLIAVSTAGLTDQATLEVEIKNQPPIIQSIIIPDSAYEDQLVYLTIGTIIDSIVDENESTYIWNLGDGSFQYGKNVSHVWTNKGIYPITLTVIDDQGAIDTTTEFLEILNVPHPDWTLFSSLAISIPISSSSYFKCGS